MTTTKAPAPYYTPQDWNDSQAAMHKPADLDAAMLNASCLAGGWYRRPVTIWMSIDEATNSEVYVLAPHDYVFGSPWTRCYTIDAHVGER